MTVCVIIGAFALFVSYVQYTHKAHSIGEASILPHFTVSVLLTVIWSTLLDLMLTLLYLLLTPLQLLDAGMRICARTHSDEEIHT